MHLIDISQFAGNRFTEILWRFPCPQKILMVTDGSLGFGTGGFGLSEFVSLVQGGGHAVSTAHRNGDINATISGNFKFDTAAPALTTANYDQIWLFGFNATALTAPEQATVAQFMQSGGGVFATGDHASLGAGMGANLPRIRSMRNWKAEGSGGIPMATPFRHDTVLDPGADNVKQFEDQSNAIPQRIFPVFFSNGGDQFVASTWSVHPVLRHPSGAVDFLPDHPHESECLAPAPVAGNFAGVVEWPAPIGGGALLAPEVVAVSVSAGRFIVSGAPTPTGTKPPVKPRCFGAISAYDGDAANAGRIVCDATWHHFININLNGSGAGLDPTTSLPRAGLYIGGVATPEYLKIQRYYLNTVRWLAPRNRRTCWPFLQLATVRFDFEIAELRLPDPHPCPWDPLLRIGRVAEDAVTRHWGFGAMEEIIDAILTTTDSSPALAHLLKTQQPTAADEKGTQHEPTLLPLQNMRRAILGSVVNQLAHHLPEDEEKLTDMLQERQGELAGKLLMEGIHNAEQAMGDYLQQALKHTTAIAKTLHAGKK